MSKVSLLDLAIQRKVDETMPRILRSTWFKERLQWAVQGFEPGFHMKDRERFTKTVARRFWWKSRRNVEIGPFRFRWFRTWQDCWQEANIVVVQFIRDERIKFGDDRYWWKDGHDLADETMSYYDE